MHGQPHIKCIHLFGFTIEIYYDARPYERQNVVLC